ncbi:multidrug effflux MFS transporter [Mycolicibacterium smegmatis]|nr:multidrug effflux MFS transporter [Mycolicibacterium smegmatis]ABK72843.1 permease of the major facilitator superfamily protein [Mycolicibacterium smegmatis MC2 155]AIU08148.1 MFS transporter [Mycolicibacterium smegmatis MC2 155]AIU14773.1 MFS transporter [Mycolicibacterium smegmatis]AIU21396.1 MFS transporter [Mycolicibacterium smegmatis]AWT53932.1 permease of the major facilitator superfamily protein [Mycolicibacterium smegmatis MKD8]
MRIRTAAPGTTTPTLALIILLALLNAVTPFSVDMYMSAFPAMAVEFGTSASVVQLTLTTFLIGLATGQLFIGQLSDRLGRRGPLLVGIVACLVASLLCAVSPSIEVLIMLRFVQGFAGAAGIVIARAIISDRSKGSQAAKLYSVMMVIGVLAPILAPVLGGQVVAGFGWRAVFLALAGLNLVMLLGALFMAGESLPPEARRPAGLKAFAGSAASVLTNRRFMGYTLTLSCSGAAMFSYISASPFVLQNIIGLSPRAFSFTFGGCALAVAVSGVISARLVGRFGPRKLLLGGVSAMVVVAALMLLNVTVGGVVPAVTVALMACFMGTVGFTFANATTLAIGEVRHAAGTGSAVIGFLQYGLGAVASPLVGLAGEHSAVPMGVAMFTCAALAATALLVLTRGHIPSYDDELADLDADLTAVSAGESTAR